MIPPRDTLEIRILKIAAPNTDRHTHAHIQASRQADKHSHIHVRMYEHAHTHKSGSVNERVLRSSSIVIITNLTTSATVSYLFAARTQERGLVVADLALNSMHWIGVLLACSIPCRSGGVDEPIYLLKQWQANGFNRNGNVRHS